MSTTKNRLILLLVSVCFMTTSLLGQTVESFDDHTAINSWGNGGSSGILATSDDFVEGTGSLDWTYEIVAGESWGGSYDIQLNPSGDYHADLSVQDGLSFYYKVLDGADPAGIASFTVKLIIESTGGTEQWQYTVAGMLDDDSGEWQEALMPFAGFAIPDWDENVFDSVLYADMITEIQMQVIVGSDADTVTGRLLLDNLAGYQEEEEPEDPEDPEPPISYGPANTNGSFEKTEPGPVTDLEDGIEGWVVQLEGDADADFEIVTDPVQHGERALKVQVNTLGPNAWSIQVIADSVHVEPGKTYLYSVWARAENSGARASFTVGNYSFAEYPNGRIHEASIPVGEWEEFTTEFPVNDESTFIRAPIHFNISGNVGNAIYIDNLTIIDPENLEVIARPVIVEAESGQVGADFEIGEMDTIQFVRITNDWWDVTPQPADAWQRPISADHVITYTVDFPAPGEYQLFVRALVGPDGADDDSFFYPEGFGEKNVEDPGDWRIANQMDVGGFTDPNDFVIGSGGAGTQVWKWLSISTGNFHEEGITYTVEDGDLRQVFQIGGRETGFAIDRIAFGRADLFYTVRNLDNGEPGSTEMEDIFIYEGPPLATGHPKFLGNIYSFAQVPSQPPLFQSYWNQVTPENAGKWGSVQPNSNPDPATWNWGELDNAYNLAKDNGWPFRFHVLVWGSQQPNWIDDLPEQEQLEAVENWFRAVADRYDDIDYLEVVNEPLPGRAVASYRGALGGDGETGWDWIITAFQMARDIFPPETKLMINEYGILGSQTGVNNYLAIVDLLLERDLIDGIGVQGHYFTTQTVSATNLNNYLDALATRGLPIQVTEMDVRGITDDAQLTEYQRVFPVLWNHPAVEGITFWGWRLGGWRPEQQMHLVNSNGSERPALAWLREYVPSTVSVEERNELPRAFQLHNNYPNPFNPSTQISYTITETAKVTLTVYDMLGRHVQTLVDEQQRPGRYITTFNADNLSTGVYLYRLQAGSSVDVKRMVYIK
jgi:endo-1,4-beta-xylanase